MGRAHPHTLGPRIAADYRLLNHLKGRSGWTMADLEAGALTIDVDGGVIAMACTEDHDEVVDCWHFYRRTGKAN